MAFGNKSMMHYENLCANKLGAKQSRVQRSLTAKASKPPRPKANVATTALLLQRVKEKGFKLLRLIWADGGYHGQPMRDWMMDLAGWLFEILKRSDDTKACTV
jgi:hypothetical protein